MVTKPENKKGAAVLSGYTYDARSNRATVVDNGVTIMMLAGNWAGHRECHIQPGWLLISRIEGDDLILVLARSDSHSDLY